MVVLRADLIFTEGDHGPLVEDRNIARVFLALIKVVLHGYLDLVIDFCQKFGETARLGKISLKILDCLSLSGPNFFQILLKEPFNHILYAILEYLGQIFYPAVLREVEKIP